MGKFESQLNLDTLWGGLARPWNTFIDSSGLFIGFNV